MIRNGKIAHLPGEIRAELNLRMDKGEEGVPLLAWLNGLREVRQTLKASFEGAPLTKQNLSEWHLGGFREWQLRQEWMDQASQLMEAGEEMGVAVDRAALPGALAAVLAGRYAALLNGWDGEPNEKLEAQVRLLRGLVRDVALLQRIMEREHQRERDLEQEFEDLYQQGCKERRQTALDLLWSGRKSE